jgi:hypothetical protein
MIVAWESLNYDEHLNERGRALRVKTRDFMASIEKDVSFLPD